MKLNEIFKHPERCHNIDKTFPHKIEVKDSGKRVFVGLDLENPKKFDLGTADVRNEMGYARYCEQYQNGQKTDTSGFVNVDVLDVAQRAIDIQAQAEQLKN